jgi:hypothetical protein
MSSIKGTKQNNPTRKAVDNSPSGERKMPDGKLISAKE